MARSLVKSFATYGVPDLVAILVEVLSPSSGVSRISARGVLKLRPDTKSGGGGGGGGVLSVSGPAGGVLSVSSPIRKAGGWGGGGAVGFWPDTKSGGEGGGGGAVGF